MLAPSLLRRHPEQVAAGLARRGWVAEQIAMRLADVATASDATLAEIARSLPNLPDAAVPTTRTIIQQTGEAAREGWQRPHWEVAAGLGWLDAPRAVKIAGPRFALLRGWGALLERALLAFMLDLHTQCHGYTEIAPPLVVRGTALGATGHLPHFQDEMYRIADAGDDPERALWLNPTAEVSLVALHAGELLAQRHLPLAYAAGIASFRREAGSAGQRTRGLLRLHQFPKVELVRITTPDDAPAAYAALTAHALAVAAALELPYRVVELPAPDLSFAAARGRDLEIWFPGIGMWIEVASISDCGSFQARRAHIRYQPGAGGKAHYPHTLNGSALAVGRTLAALIEHGQTPSGAVRIPPALRPYVGGAEIAASA
jgi:seryl-tRNA synthetase